MLVGRDGDDRGQWQLGDGVGRDVANGRVGQELHDHADVVRHRREHHGRQVHVGRARRVRLLEQLRRRLAEVADLVLHSLLHHGVAGQGPQVHAALVR